jgi:hypothetical protein
MGFLDACGGCVGGVAVGGGQVKILFDIEQRSAVARGSSWTLRSTLDGRDSTYNAGDLMGRPDEVACGGHFGRVQ